MLLVSSPLDQLDVRTSTSSALFSFPFPSSALVPSPSISNSSVSSSPFQLDSTPQPTLLTPGNSPLKSSPRRCTTRTLFLSTRRLEQDQEVFPSANLDLTATSHQDKAISVELLLDVPMDLRLETGQMDRLLRSSVRRW